MRKRPAFKLPQTVDPDMRSFSCQLCTSKLKSRSNLNNHIKAVHEKDKPFECLICSVRFSFNSQLKKHSKNVHEKTYNYVKCQLCIPEKLFSKSYLKDHVRSVHEKIKLFKCQMCLLTFSHNNSLKYHITGLTIFTM